MLDMKALQNLVAQYNIEPLFVTVSGSHLYGFSSPDSDIDLRGCHRLPLREIVGLYEPNETTEKEMDLGGIEVEWVSHDVGKYLRLLTKNNGYILEQVFSPLVITGQEFLDRLRPIAKNCITRHHYHHYRGFIATQRKMLDKEEPKRVKTLLYAYRVLLTGTHLMQTGEVEANLPALAERFGLTFIPDLIAQKTEEKITAPTLDWPWHAEQLSALEARLDQAFVDSTLPEERDLAAVHALLVDVRLSTDR